jgi:hypothetical protein
MLPLRFSIHPKAFQQSLTVAPNPSLTSLQRAWQDRIDATDENRHESLEKRVQELFFVPHFVPEDAPSLSTLANSMKSKNILLELAEKIEKLAGDLTEALPAPLQEMPAEILDKVFSHLPKECRNQIPLLSSFFAIHMFAFRIHESDIKMTAIGFHRVLQRCGTKVLQLDFSRLQLGENPKLLHPRFFKACFKRCPELKTVAFFQNEMLTPKDLPAILPRTVKYIYSVGCSKLKDAQTVRNACLGMPELKVEVMDASTASELPSSLKVLDFFQLPSEARGKLLLNGSKIQNLLSNGMVFAHFCQLTFEERELLYELANQNRHILCSFLQSTVTVTQICKTPLPTLKRFFENPELVRKLLSLGVTWEKLCKLTDSKWNILIPSKGTIDGWQNFIPASQILRLEEEVLNHFLLTFDKITTLLMTPTQFSQLFALASQDQMRILQNYKHVMTLVIDNYPVDLATVLHLTDDELASPELTQILAEEKLRDFLTLEPSLRQKFLNKAKTVLQMLVAKMPFEKFVQATDKQWANLIELIWQVQSGS